ncbi:MAG TPA: 5-guanidino-2-oxopentanoate decarboxylase [Solirubrobacteraceae bacterium]|nr:5-guanidino-2-oxopentanoate decarboxylase [Solirubrobacteraceae bacterium]
MRKITGGQAVVDSLAAHDVEVVWGIPGTHNLEIYAHLNRSGIRHLLPRHEQGAAFAADGYARVTGRAGVCLTTTGPAVLNAATALAQSWSDSVPVLLVSAGLPLRHPGRGNGYLHEAKDLHGAMQALVAYSHRVTSVEEIPSAVAQAFATMTGGRPRPVHIEIPLDVLAERANVLPIGPIAPATAVPDPTALDAAATRLAAGRRRVVIAGGGARKATAELLAIAEALAAPVITTFNGKGTVPSEHPLVLGSGLHRAVVAELLADSDTVLVVGSELAPADMWNGPPDLAGKVVRIDIDADQTVTNAIPDATVVGDAATVLRGLLERSQSIEDDDDRRAQIRAWRKRFGREARQASERWDWLLAPIGDALGADGVLVGDSATVCYYGAAVSLPAAAPGSFLYPTGFGTLGYGLPAGIGAKVGRPDATVIVLIGDGGIMFTLAELAAAAQAGVGLAIVVVDNGGYGEIRAEMEDRGDAPIGVELPAPDFVALAQALGCRGEHVEFPAELAAALEGARSAPEPTLIHTNER